MKKFIYYSFILIILSIAGCTNNKQNQAENVEVAFKKVLSTNGSTRATAYSMSNKIISADGKIFVAWLDHVADIQVKSYDIASETWSETVLMGAGVDNHSGPAITMDSEGFIYAVFGPHHGPFQFVRSSVPHSIEKWDRLPEFGYTATYPSLICGPDDMLHITYRGGDEPWKIMYQQKPKNGEWTTPRELVDSSVEDGYTQYGNSLAVASDSTLHLGFHIYDFHPKAGKFVGYLRSQDNGATWETAEGVKVELPATPDTPCFLEKGPELDMRLTTLVTDTESNPWFLAVHLESSPRTVKMWRHNGVRWDMTDLLPIIKKHFPDHEVLYGTLTFDRDGMLYIVATIQSPNAEKWWGDPGLEVILLTSADNGQSFAVHPISEPDPSLPNWLASIERPFCPKPIGVPSFMFTHGGPGEGVTGGDATEVVFVRLKKD